MLSDTLKHRRTVSHNYCVRRQRMTETCCFFECDNVPFGPFVTCSLNANISLVQRSFMHQRVLGGLGLPARFKCLICLSMPFLSRAWETTHGNGYVSLINMIGTKYGSTADYFHVISWFDCESRCRTHLNHLSPLLLCLYTPPRFFFSMRAIIALMHMANKRLTEKSLRVSPLNCAGWGLRLNSRKKP